MVTLTSELAQRIPPTHKVSFEEYIEWLDEDTQAEWVDGEIVLMSPATLDHQNAGLFLSKVLSIYVEVKDLGHIVLAPYVMKLAAISRGREPDIIFVRKDREHLLTRHYLDGPADLAVEIVSPDSRRRDRKEKFKEYEAAGVLEYWLFEPDHEQAEFYRLDDDDGRYRRVEIGADGIYRSKVIPGFWLKVEWLWQTPPPATLDVMRELKVL